MFRSVIRSASKARISFECLESDKVMLTYQVYWSLTDMIDDLTGDPVILVNDAADRSKKA